MYMYMCMHVYACVHVNININVNVYVYVELDISVYRHTYLGTRTFVYTCVPILHIYICLFMCVNHTLIHI